MAPKGQKWPPAQTYHLQGGCILHYLDLIFRVNTAVWSLLIQRNSANTNKSMKILETIGAKFAIAVSERRRLWIAIHHSDTCTSSRTKKLVVRRLCHQRFPPINFRKPSNFMKKSLFFHFLGCKHWIFALRNHGCWFQRWFDVHKLRVIPGTL